MIPDKIHWLLGYQHLSMLLEQERKHWLMKVYRKKQIQDKATGKLFQGTIENLGTDIMIESQQMKEVNTNITSIQFTQEEINQLFEPDYAAFCYCNDVNGLSIARITSINHQTTGQSTHNGYKIRFKNCKVVTLPLAASSDSPEVYATKWIQTDTVQLLFPNRSNQFTNVQNVSFTNNITNAFFLYPLTENLQPLNLTNEGNGNYITEAIVKDEFIGYPAFWFVCDQTKLGPYITYSDDFDYPLIHIGNEGNDVKYHAKVYVNIDRANNTPDDGSTDQYVIYVSPKVGEFTNTAGDFNSNLSNIIHFENTSTGDVYDVTIHDNQNAIRKLYMDEDVAWTYKDVSRYEIQMNVFDNNAATYALKALLRIQLNEEIPFTNINETELGYAGMRFSSSNLTADAYPYPYDLNKWDGLPDYLNELDHNSTQYGALYAIHNTPLYDPAVPNSRQTAAILLDPGQNDMIGSDYDLSNLFDVHWTSNDLNYGVDTITLPSTIGIRFIRRGKNLSNVIDEEHDVAEFPAVRGYDENNNLIFTARLECLDLTNEAPNFHPWQEDDADCDGGIKTLSILQWFGNLDKTYFNITRIAATSLMYNDNTGNGFAYKNDDAYVCDDIGAHLQLYVLGETNKPGRVYVLSNDDIEYKNNATTTYPKPERTVARICDIPTSIVQLSNIKNLAPTSIVDPLYVRTEVSFTEEDKNQIYNILPTRWVRPTAVDIGGELIYLHYPNQNQDKFVFQSVDLLNKVDLIYHNAFRSYTNLNPKVPVEDVSVANISSNGSGYKVNDFGLLIIGGIPFEYHVETITNAGEVTSVVLSQSSENIDSIPLSNFDIPSDTHGITSPYGTSPLSGNGTGLKLRLMIAHYDDICMQKDEIFDDLFAFVKDADGISLYEYEINKKSTAFPKTGTWVQKTVVSPFENSSYHSSEGVLSTSDALMSYIVPRLQSLPVATADPNLESTVLQVYHSPSFVNVLDTTKTPVKMPSTITGNDKLDTNYVDLTRFYCDGIKTGYAKEYSTQGVIDYLKEYGEEYFDTFVFYKWTDRSANQFQYGHIRRGFNNLMSTDTTALLPANQLVSNKYVHANANTTIAWDVPEVGVMLWTYNPTCTKKETYTIDPETRDLHIQRTDLTWKDIEIFNMEDGTTFKLVNSGNRMLYNILSNNPEQVTADKSVVFYQQPELRLIARITELVTQADYSGPTGNWQLVFPRVNEYTIKNITDGRTFTPLKLNMIRGDHISNADEVLDENGHVINHKTILVSDTGEEVTLKMYNTERGIWEQV